MAASALLLSLAGCDKLRDGAESRAQVPLVNRVLDPQEAQKLAAQLCSATNTYERLKIAAFRQAARVRGSDSAPFDRLAAFATIRMEEPLVVSGERAPRLIRCSARMAIDLPPGTSAMNGARSLASDVAFSAQPAADGTGLVWTLSAAEPIVYPLATLRRVSGEEFLPAPVVPAIFGTPQPPQPAAQAPANELAEAQVPAPAIPAQAPADPTPAAEDPPAVPVKQADPPVARPAAVPADHIAKRVPEPRPVKRVGKPKPAERTHAVDVPRKKAEARAAPEKRHAKKAAPEVKHSHKAKPAPKPVAKVAPKPKPRPTPKAKPKPKLVARPAPHRRIAVAKPVKAAPVHRLASALVRPSPRHVPARPAPPRRDDRPPPPPPRDDEY